MECVDKRELEQFLQGKLSPERLLAVDAHVRECPTCKVAAESLAASTRLFASFAAELVNAADCPDYETLSALADQTLPADQLRLAQAHINACEVCSRDIDRIRELRSQAELRGVVRIERAPQSRRRAPWLTWHRAITAAATACALVALGLTIWQPRPPGRVALPPMAKKPLVGKQDNIVATKPLAPEKPATGSKATTVATTPVRQPTAKPKPTVLLADGRYKLVRDTGRIEIARADGRAIGTGLEARLSRMIDEKIRTGKIKPAESVRVAMNTIHLRSGESYSPPPTAPRQVYPIGVMLASDRPLLTWSSVELAESYRVVITDAQGNTVFERATDQTSLTVPDSLPRGRVYVWRVGARFSESDAWANSRAAAFKVLSSQDMSLIEQTRRQFPGSHLALATVYESLGLYQDATSEYRSLRRANANSSLARQLLHAPIGDR